MLWSALVIGGVVLVGLRVARRGLRVGALVGLGVLVIRAAVGHGRVRIAVLVGTVVLGGSGLLLVGVLAPRPARFGVLAVRVAVLRVAVLRVG
jgi:hypothetical protein